MPQTQSLPKENLKQDASLLNIQIYRGFTGIQAYLTIQEELLETVFQNGLFLINLFVRTQKCCLTAVFLPF